jgi:2-oxoglutarate dehydrogenase E1 component
MYDLIEAKRPVRKIYTESLIGRGDITLEDAENAVNHFRDRLEDVLASVRNPDLPPENVPYRLAPGFPTKPSEERAPAISKATMDIVAGVYTNLPEGFTVHPRVAPQLERRARAIQEGPIDWATAELLAFGSLLVEKRPVRLVGQDSRRGTYSQRFGAVVDRVTNEAWVPLKHLTTDQASFDIFDSPLNEYGALGFEYGYSVAAPDALVCWEAQYGDFVNGAQIISDEFITSGYVKWEQKSGVVLLLPHGYEGAGPDHSSARLERWLEAAAEGNVAVCQPSTPASYFHLLRQHAYINLHRPLIVATPKSMLRTRAAVSQPDEILQGRWLPALDDPTIADPSGVERILLCSGRVRWDLVAERRQRGLEGKVAILALERLYPLPDQELARELARYPQVRDIRFVQDEPENQGPWWFLERELTPAIRRLLGSDSFTMAPVTRPAAAAPAVGSYAVHARQQRDLLDRAFAPERPQVQ